MDEPKPKVMKSLHNKAVDRCVDIFQRLDGSWGFKQFRRDIEDQGAWFPISGGDNSRFVSLEDAETAARGYVAWLLD